MRPIERKLLANAVISDLIDLLPNLPILDQIEDVTDAQTIIAAKSAFPDNSATTALQLIETIELDFPIIPSPTDLLPLHTFAVAEAIRKRIQKKIGRKFELPKLK